MKQLARRLLAEIRLPERAKAQRAVDHRGLPARASTLPALRDALIDWLCAAQDHSSTNDGGVARDYSLLTGWNASYPETTGYIVPTMLRAAESLGRDELRERAVRMLDWLAAIQFPDGGIQGSVVNATPRVPVTFNTGQVLIGLSIAARSFPQYEAPMHRAAVWLRDSLDSDGCWRQFPTPFAARGEKAYETHVAWGLYEAARTSGDTSYAAAADANVHWAIGKQERSGWFADNCLDQPAAPLTHTIGYLLRGLVESLRYRHDAAVLDAALRCARPLAAAVREDGFLAGRLNRDWTGTVPWVCLTGSVQIATGLRLLDEHLGTREFNSAAARLQSYVFRSISVEGPAETRGAVRGSFPVDGDYGRWQYLNWAAKFSLDAVLDEIERPLHGSASTRSGTRSGGRMDCRPRNRSADHQVAEHLFRREATLAGRLRHRLRGVSLSRIRCAIDKLRRWLRDPFSA